MKIKSLFFLVLVVILPACTTMQKTTSYSVKLASVEDSFEKQVLQDVQIVEGITNDGSASYLFEDELMNVMWSVNDEVFAFALENKSTYPITIPWDDVYYYDWQGNIHRVIHKNVKYINATMPQSSTIIHKDSTLAEYLLPSTNIHESTGLMNSSYRIKSLFPSYISQKKADKSALKGQFVRIKFPVIVGNEKKEYIFGFKIEDITVQ